MSLGPMPPTFERRDIDPRHEGEDTKNSFLWLGIALVVVVGVVWFAATVVWDRFTDSVVEPVESTTVEVGDAFEVGPASAAEGWSLSTDADGDSVVEGLRLTNESEATGEVEVVLTFLDGKRPLATVECGVDRLRPGASAEATCTGPETTFDDADGVLVAERPSL